MTQIAISVKNVSKKYSIGKLKDSSLRGSLAQIFAKKETKFDTFLALNDVSFDIQRGDVVGIIGKNGAGKSTLLKILSQITRPSDGEIEINGRVASLLEVGTGFHPELTGRENVYLNGTILGMTRKEVAAKFDEIVAFSGVEKFIDTPVKHYSSGMYVRLAFAVAAHLEPEILIIDEVLAVGDAEFQKKCLGKMNDVAGEGRTVLFVSHDLGAVKQLCNKGILLQSGRVEYVGSVEEAIKQYENVGMTFSKDYSNSDGIIRKVHLGNTTTNIYGFNEDIIFDFVIDTSNLKDGTVLGVAIKDSNTKKLSTLVYPLNKLKKNYTLKIFRETFYSGLYSIDVAVYKPNSVQYEYISDICLFEVNDYLSFFSNYKGIDIGSCNLNVTWDAK